MTQDNAGTYTCTITNPKSPGGFWLASYPVEVQIIEGEINPEGNVPDATELAALQALYSATDGSSWETSTNWLQGTTNADFATWFGVTVENGDVVAIELPNNNLRGTLPDELDDLTDLRRLHIQNNGFNLNSIANYLTGPDTYSLEEFIYKPQVEIIGEATRDTVSVDEDITLQAFTNNHPQTRFQWQKLEETIWTTIEGEEQETLVITGAVLDDAGQYRCRITSDWISSMEQFSAPITLVVEGDLDPQTQALHDYVNSMTNPNLLPASWNLSNPVDTWAGVVMVEGWVTEVTLTDKNVGGSIPPSFENLEKLEKLNLTATGLTGSIPEELGALVDLTHLQLGTNSLSGAIPTALGSLTQLVSVNLSYNTLTGKIPDLGPLTSLRLLQLQYNQLTGGIPASLAQLEGLKTLRLSTNPLGGTIPEELFQLPALEKLYLANNSLTDTIPPAIAQLDSLTELDLGGNRLEGDIPEAFNDLVALEKLYLHNNQLSYLPDLTIHPNADQLDLRVDGNQLPLADVAYLHTGTEEHPFKELRYDKQQEGVATATIVGQVFTLGRDVAVRADIKEHPEHRYQWQKKGGNGDWQNITGAAERLLVIPSATANDAQQDYRVVVTNGYATQGNARSAAVEPESSGYERYVRVFSPRNTVAAENVDEITLTATSSADVSVRTDYIDGMGRTVQTVARGAGGTRFQDVVQFTQYDDLGRPEKSYLPYATDDVLGTYRPEATQQQAAFYQDRNNDVVRDQYPFGEARYEASPLSRVVEQGAPGQAWQLGSGHTATMSYRTNTAADDIAQLTMSGTTVTVASEPYANGTLAVTTTTDENGHYVKEYRNRAGQTVLKQVEGPAGDLVTYSVYDLRGQLRMTVPPEAVNQLAGDWSRLNDPDFRNRWLFVYDYDKFQRMAAEHVPGGGTTKMIYDRWGRPVYSQSAAMREANTNQWTFTKYDYLDRPILSGVFVASAEEATLRSQVLTTTNRYENRVNTGTIGYTLGNSHPTSVNEATLRTVSYYDDYAFPHATDSDMAFANDLGGQTKRSTMKGEVTGSLTRNLSDKSWLRSVVYYDEQYRPIAAVTENHLGGTDRTATRYADAVRDEVEQTITKHTTNSGTHAIRQTYDYDHQGRLLQVKHQVDGAEVTLATHAYNTLGQLVAKKLNDNAPADQVTQTLDYRYHIRGWLAGINELDDTDDYYAQELIYEVGGNHTQYNGNPTKLRWKNRGEKAQTYNYRYDPADRLTEANHFYRNSTGSWVAGGFTLKVPGYDANGNITDLKRFTKGSAEPQLLDFLRYTYLGNRLVRVKERNGGDGTRGFVEGVDHASEYEYDASGNLTKDKNKSIRKIIYDPVLNLPLEVRTTTGTMRYAYDAAGIKLSQTVLDADGNEMITTDYDGAFEYTNGQLSLIHHNEGRICFPDNGTDGVYHFDLKDHLGNVRATFSPEPIITRRVARWKTIRKRGTTKKASFRTWRVAARWLPTTPPRPTASRLTRTRWLT